MNKQIKEIARQKVGQYLKAIREEKGITTYQLTKQFGIRFEAIKAIEEGSANYSIDNFLAYIQAVDCYFYLANRDGQHLNPNDLLNKMKTPPENNLS